MIVDDGDVFSDDDTYYVYLIVDNFIIMLI